MKARDIMTVGCMVVSADNSVRHAARIMLDSGVSGLPVLDDTGRIIGIITEGDLLRRMELGGPRPRIPTPERRAIDYLKRQGWKVADVMSRDVVIADENESVDSIAALMAEHGVKRVPVLRDGKLVGMVTRRDLLKAICAAPQEPIASGDAAIARTIRTRLDQDLGLGKDRVNVSVRRGVVHLGGTVGSEAEREAVRALVEDVSNVNGIEFDLSVAAR
ncbi:CBS domain-containing protein [Chelativorans intermedius]|uniref:CBS domain-containing protein n=1 Tax=Chelativorans intermedius TaxID=515947 RepID=A0ABV6DAN8_9HYPH|nr:CBS domain-containing protein [Chelativorans intermedius]MCT9000154.1 CBS domain-containing protein [Chelativorans intermedius]